VRLTDHAPIACSSCGHQDVEMKHVDFEAAWDGPVISRTENGDVLPIDDLIVCEQCVREAAQLFDLTTRFDAKKMRDQVKLLEAELADKTARLQSLSDAVTRQAVPA
jgi:hypothetical protein